MSDFDNKQTTFITSLQPMVEIECFPSLGCQTSGTMTYVFPVFLWQLSQIVSGPMFKVL